MERSVKHGRENLENAAYYSFGRFQTQLEILAATVNVPVPALTQRVCELLSGAAGGEILGAEDRVPAMRSNAAKGSHLRQSTVAVAGSAHSGGTRGQGEKSKSGGKVGQAHARIVCPVEGCGRSIGAGQINNHLHNSHGWGLKQARAWKAEHQAGGAAQSADTSKATTTAA
jgi:hypothetical protein